MFGMDIVKEQRYAEDITRGDTEAWGKALHHITLALSSWKTRHEVDIEDVIVNSLWKAGKTYNPKRKSFIHYAIHITHTALCYEYRKKRLSTCELTEASAITSKDTPQLNRMIAKEEIDSIFQHDSPDVILALLMNLGNTHTEAARKMGVSRFQGLRMVKRIRGKICPV